MDDRESEGRVKLKEESLSTIEENNKTPTIWTQEKQKKNNKY